MPRGRHPDAWHRTANPGASGLAPCRVPTLGNAGTCGSNTQTPGRIRTISRPFWLCRFPYPNVSVLAGGQAGTSRHHGERKGRWPVIAWCSGCNMGKRQLASKQAGRAGWATNRILPGALGDKLQLPVSSSPGGPPMRDDMLSPRPSPLLRVGIKLPGAFFLAFSLRHFS